LKGVCAGVSNTSNPRYAARDHGMDHDDAFVVGIVVAAILQPGCNFSKS
jgi:hypothetical protein